MTDFIISQIVKRDVQGHAIRVESDIARLTAIVVELLDVQERTALDAEYTQGLALAASLITDSIALHLKRFAELEAWLEEQA